MESHHILKAKRELKDVMSYSMRILIIIVRNFVKNIRMHSVFGIVTKYGVISKWTHLAGLFLGSLFWNNEESSFPLPMTI